MTEYFFGQSVTRSFYPSNDGTPINLPTQTPEVFLFSAQPSLEDAIAGTGAFSTISAWTEVSTTPYERRLSYPPIYDPEPTSSSTSLGIWEVIKFRYESGGAVQSKMQYFDVQRPEAASSDPGTSTTDIIAAYPAISSYLTTDQLGAILGQARILMRTDIEAAGFKWSRVQNLDQTKLALAYRAIAESSLSQVREPNDRFAYRYDIYSKKYKDELSKITFKHDRDGDGQVDEIAPAQEKAWRMSR